MHFFLILISALTPLLWAQTPPKIPKEAQDLLNTLPEKKVTVDLVVSRAIQQSDRFRAIDSASQSLESSRLQSLDPLDFQIRGSASRLLNENEPASPFSTKSIKTTEFFTVGISKAFSSGTSFDLEVKHSDTDLEFALPANNTSYFETKSTLTFEQALWKNGFGYSIRRQVGAGEKQSIARQNKHDGDIDHWVIDLVDFFYQAWLNQARTSAATSGLERRKRLLNITRLKLQRGTSERPDFLQVESAVIQAETQHSDSAQRIGNIWRELVTSLKYPETWISIDPMLVPLQLDEPIGQSLAVCGKGSYTETVPSQSSLTLERESSAAASQLQWESAKNLTKPDLKIFAQLVTNAIDRNESPTWSEASHLDHPAWLVGVKVQFPLMGYRDEANSKLAATQAIRDDALFSSSKSDLKVQWIDACTNLQRLSDIEINRQIAYTKQIERVKLEEERFRLGRINTLVVIQAGDDATSAELELRAAQIASRQAAWQVLRLAGQVKDYYLKMRSATE